MNDDFNPMEFAYEKWGETLEYMSDEQILYYTNEDDLDSYLRCFYERT